MFAFRVTAAQLARGRGPLLLLLQQVGRLARPQPPLLSAKRDFHPVAFLGVLLIKKVAVFSALHAYGLPRLYRRLLEQNKAIIPTSLQKQTKDAVRLCFDYPTRIYGTVRDNEQLTRILTELSSASTGLAGNAASATSSIPAVVVDVSRTILEFVGLTAPAARGKK
jgi:hypothetical protein